MAKLTVGKGIDQYIRKLQNLAYESEDMVSRAIYKGAGAVADAIKAEARSLPTSEEPGSGVLNKAQKAGVVGGMGISKLQNEEGTFYRKIGWAWRNRNQRTYYEKGEKITTEGQYNVTVVRNLVTGSNGLKRNNFIQKAIRQSRTKAEQAIADYINKATNDTMN